LVSGVSYSASPEERRWRLTLASAKTGKRRLYIAENGMPLSKAEMAQRTHQYHGTWSVIEPE
jgi:hypothetical protein